MAKAGGHGSFGAKLQSYVKCRAEEYGCPLRECIGSGNKFSSDSDLTNRQLQIECKGKTSRGGIAMPSKKDWMKLKKETEKTGRISVLVTSGTQDMSTKRNAVLATLELDALLYLIQLEGAEYEF